MNSWQSLLKDPLTSLPAQPNPPHIVADAVRPSHLQALGRPAVGSRFDRFHSRGQPNRAHAANRLRAPPVRSKKIPPAVPSVDCVGPRPVTFQSQIARDAVRRRPRSNLLSKVYMTPSARPESRPDVFSAFSSSRDPWLVGEGRFPTNSVIKRISHELERFNTD